MIIINNMLYFFELTVYERLGKFYNGFKVCGEKESIRHLFFKCIHAKEWIHSPPFAFVHPCLPVLQQLDLWLIRDYNSAAAI